MVGGVIMVHGDDGGLILPPRIAPYQVVIVPIMRGNWRETVLPKAKAIRDELRRRVASASCSTTATPRRPGGSSTSGRCAGVPLRLEIGPKDIEKSQVVLARRDTREKSFTPMDGLAAHTETLLNTIQQALFDRAIAFRQEHTTEADSYATFTRGHGGPSRIRDLSVVWVGGLRSVHQSRDAGDDSEHPVREPAGHGKVVHQVR